VRSSPWVRTVTEKPWVESGKPWVRFESEKPCVRTEAETPWVRSVTEKVNYCIHPVRCPFMFEISAEPIERPAYLELRTDGRRALFAVQFTLRSRSTEKVIDALPQARFDCFAAAPTRDLWTEGGDGFFGHSGLGPIPVHPKKIGVSIGRHVPIPVSCQFIGAQLTPGHITLQFCAHCCFPRPWSSSPS